MNNEFKIYVANLGKYNEGKLIGAWLELPLYGDFEEEFEQFLEEKVGVLSGTEYEEYAVHDYTLPFKFGEHDSVERLNEILELIDNHGLDSEDLQLLSKYENGFDGFCELLSAYDDGYITFHYNKNMEEIAYSYIHETGMLSDVNETLARYFDYAAYGRDMQMEGNFIEFDGNIIEDSR